MYSLYSGLYSKISMYKALCTDTHCVTALHSYTVLYSYTALHIIQLYSAIVHYNLYSTPLVEHRPHARRQCCEWRAAAVGWWVPAEPPALRLDPARSGNASPLSRHQGPSTALRQGSAPPRAPLDK